MTKVFPGSAEPAVADLSLEMPAGSIVVLVGPSGCGKTTTLRMINRLEEPTSGRILLGDVDVARQPVHELRRRIGYVIQHAGLFPHQTIEGNIGTVPRLLGWDKVAIRDRVRELADLLGLAPDLLPRYPAELSGGQQQRVGVARALAADPPVLLMDEPYSAVDPIVRHRLQDELLALQARVGKTIVLVTHDVDEAIKLGDRIALLNTGGVVEQYGTPDELLREPANQFVATFLGRERGLKRLALLTVADVALGEAIDVDADAGVDQAKAVMDRHRVDWIGVRRGERILGWARAGDLDGRTCVGDAPLEPFRATVTRSTPLREALDVIITSRTGVAVVLDGDRYVGMLGIDRISEGIR